jgi:hypothetical protein
MCRRGGEPFFLLSLPIEGREGGRGYRLAQEDSISYQTALSRTEQLGRRFFRIFRLTFSSLSQLFSPFFHILFDRTYRRPSLSSHQSRLLSRASLMFSCFW